MYFYETAFDLSSVGNSHKSSSTSAEKIKQGLKFDNNIGNAFRVTFA